MFSFADIWEIVKTVNDDCKSGAGFCRQFFSVDDYENISYWGSKEVNLGTNMLIRKETLTTPPEKLRWAVIYSYSHIADAVWMRSFKGETEIRTAKESLGSLLASCESAQKFIKENIYPSLLSSDETGFRILLFVALLTAAGAFDDEDLLKAQKVDSVKAFADKIYAKVLDSEIADDAAVKEKILAECAGVKSFEEMIMGYANIHSCPAAVYCGMLSGESFFELFPVAAAFSDVIAAEEYADACKIMNELLCRNEGLMKLLELAVCFSGKCLERKVLEAIAPGLSGGISLLLIKGIIKEVKSTGFYRLSYGWQFFLTETKHKISRNALRYCEEFPVLPKLVTLGRFDLLEEGLDRLDFTEAEPVREYMVQLIKKAKEQSAF